jgi:hypothetical protein
MKMMGLVFTLVSAIIGVAMFGAILLAPGSAKAEASVASASNAGDGSPAVVETIKHRAFDGAALGEIRIANTNVNGGASDRDAPAKPQRPGSDREPRTQVAGISQSPANWQMAAQIPNTQTMLRQM